MSRGAKRDGNSTSTIDKAYRSGKSVRIGLTRNFDGRWVTTVIVLICHWRTADTGY
jgi:hypothetical protein